MEHKLTDLESQAIEALPDREEMSLVNAIALNVLSDNSTAFAQATQTNYIPQSI